MAQPLSGLDYLERRRLADYQMGLAREAQDFRRQQATAEYALQERRQKALADYQSLALQAKEREGQRRIEMQHQELQARPNRIIETKSGIFERTPGGLRELKHPTTGKPLEPKEPKPPPPAPFEAQLQRETAKQYTKTVEDSTRMGDQLDLTKKAINQFRDYTQSQILGTGPIATLMGTTKYLSSKTEALEAVFRTINLKNMIATFSGMSRAIDTDAERRAWEATQPGVALDDPTNAQILVGGLSLAAKTQMEGEARRRYIESSPDKTLKGYVSPVIGKTSVLFNAEGDPVVVPKDKIDEFVKQGLMTDSDYQKQILGERPKRRETDKPKKGWSIKEIP